MNTRSLDSWTAATEELARRQAWHARSWYVVFQAGLLVALFGSMFIVSRQPGAGAGIVITLSLVSGVIVVWAITLLQRASNEAAQHVRGWYAPATADRLTALSEAIAFAAGAGQENAGQKVREAMARNGLEVASLRQRDVADLRNLLFLPETLYTKDLPNERLKAARMRLQKVLSGEPSAAGSSEGVSPA